MRIINFGSLNIDHVYKVDHISRPGETIASTSYTIFAGGKGANQSVAIARAGGNVLHAGKIGRDGLWMVQNMELLGVDVSNIIIDDQPTGHAVIQVDKNGQNSIVICGGTNRKITTPEIDRIIGLAAADDIVLVQNEINNIPYVFEAAAKRKLPLCFNPAPMAPEVKGYPLDKVSIFIINQTEGAEITGGQGVQDICTRMVEKFPQATVILTLGAEGAMFARGSERTSVAGKKVTAVDTTGAGDTFIGFFLSNYAQGKPVRDCMEKANEAAAISVTQPGATASIAAI
jgi:ribokinase